MTEQEWLTSSDPQAMLGYVRLWDAPSPGEPSKDRRRISNRKMRLFCCACCRLRGSPSIVAWYEQCGAPMDEYDVERMTDERWAIEWVRKSGDASTLSQAQKADLLREIVGNPFRPVQKYDWYGVVKKPDHFNVRWLTPTVLSLAQAAYDECGERKCDECGGCGSFEADEHTPAGECIKCKGTGVIHDGSLDPACLAVLSDALEEAGCNNKEVLMHLRGFRPCKACPREDYRNRDRCVCATNGGWVLNFSPHVRGCWVLDLLLGSE